MTCKVTLLRSFCTSMLLVTAFVISIAQPPEILYYKFDQESSLVANHATNPPMGTENATILGMHQQGGNGFTGGALIGNGGLSGGNYVNTNWAPSLSGSWTIAFWSGNIDYSIELQYIFGDPNAAGLRCFTGGVAGPGNWILRGPMPDIHATNGAIGNSFSVFVYDHTSSSLKAYVNGTLVDSVSTSGVNISGPGPFKIGGYANSNALRAGGLLDEFRIYSRALTQEEIDQLDFIPPVVNALGRLGAFESCTNLPSAAQSISISGSNLLNNIVVTAPENFEVSDEPNSNFGAQLSIAPVNASVLPTNIYVRMIAHANGIYEEELTISSDSAESVTIPLNGNTITCALPEAKCFTNTVVLTVTPGNLVYNGPGTADVYSINASLLDNNSTSTTTATREAARTLYPVTSTTNINSVFNWTTQGICTDATPNGNITDEDKGYSWESCLAVTPSDFNKIKNYKLKITNIAGSSTCTNGKYKIVYSNNPQSPEFTIINDGDQVEFQDEDTSMKVYPNPGNNNLYIDLNLAPEKLTQYTITILDVMGKKVYQNGALDATFIDIDMSAFAAGSYFIHLKSQDESIVKKWMKI